MNLAVPTAFLSKLGLVSFLDEHLRLKRQSQTAVYGTVRTVVWEDGEGNLPSYPIRWQCVGRSSGLAAHGPDDGHPFAAGVSSAPDFA